MDANIYWVLGAVLAGFVVAVLLGRVLIPALRALKAGQSIREVGPKWHNGKAGTPTMGGLTFIAASALCIPFGIFALKRGEYSQLLVLALALMFGAIGFYDDFYQDQEKAQPRPDRAAKAGAANRCGSHFPAGDAFFRRTQV